MKLSKKSKTVMTPILCLYFFTVNHSYAFGIYEKIFYKKLEITRNTKRGSITVPLTSCLTGLDESVLQIKTKILSSHTPNSKQVK